MRDFERALEDQLDLINLLKTNDARLRAMLNVWTSDARGAMGRVQMEGRGDVGEAYRQHLLESANTAETVWVTEEMGELLKVAAETLPPHELHPSDVPMPRGFARFEKPIVVPVWVSDEQGWVDVPILAVMWTERMVRRSGVGKVPGVEATWWVDPRGTYMGVETGNDVPRWCLDTESGWSYGKDWTEHRHTRDTDDPPLPDDAPQDVHTWDARHLLSLWMLMKQRVAGATRVEASRSLRRRAVRTSPDFGVITVVDLRRQVVRDPDAPETEPGEGPPEWSHRWIVSGHWRRQYYPSDGVHRPIWIAPFVKGPEDAPLILKDRVYRLVR